MLLGAGLTVATRAIRQSSTTNLKMLLLSLLITVIKYGKNPFKIRCRIMVVCLFRVREVGTYDCATYQINRQNMRQRARFDSENCMTCSNMLRIREIFLAIKAFVVDDLQYHL